MTPRADLLDEVKPPGKIKYVAAASGALLPVIGVGNAKVKGANGELVGLGNVLLVKGLSANLLSVRRLQKSKAEVTFGPTSCRAKLGKKVLWSLEEETSCIKDLWQLPIIPWNGKTPTAVEQQQQQQHESPSRVPHPPERPRRDVRPPVRLTYGGRGRPNVVQAGSVVEQIEEDEIAHCYWAPIPEPKTREEALNGPNGEKWKANVEKGVLRLHQRKYCEGLAEKYGLQDGGKPATPLPSGFTVEPCADEEVVGESDRKLFHSMVGSLNYAANHTRPDIAFSTSRLASVVSRPSHEQLEAAKRLVRYLAKNACLHGLTKHIRPKWHWVRRLLDKEVRLEIVKTHQQAADIFTKRLAEADHWKGMKLAGMSVH
ncbi:hypothetical protein CLOM_g16203 [Closterium sp. NIES-68]|nr:hypothetical protein CLOM_g16203 [Closterium sp. NIES-68]